jgi:glycosidase
MKTLRILIILLVPVLSLAQNIERAEPPFWWVGMQNTELQIMLYGKDIAMLKPVINYEGVSISRAGSLENLNYLFIYLNIHPSTVPGSIRMDFLDEKGKIKFSYPYELLQRDEGSAQQKGYDNSDVLYLVTPDRFSNGNTDNDAIDGLLELPDRGNKGGRHGGDIQGIINGLDYLSDMGFTAIWLNPIVENNQKVYSYHGYSTTDYFKIDPRFGTNEEYRALAEKANEKGIKIVMDMIMNHCGSGHWWMNDLPSDDWVNNPDNYFMTNHRRTTLRDPYTSEYDRRHFSDGWFVPSMPDLNQRNPLLADYLIQNTLWWIEYIHLSGIRMDTYPYSDKSFMSDWTCAVMNEYPNFNICGEDWSLNPAVLAYWQKGKNNPDGYTSCLPGLLDFPLQNALVKALREEENWNAGMINLYETLSNDFLYPDPFKHVIFPDNHDMSRIYSQLNEDLDLYKLAMVYFATMRGTPQFYYGTEILMSNTGDDSHGNIRSDFPGGWAGDPVNAFTGEGLSDQQKEAQEFVKNLLNWRKSANAIHHGKLKHFVPQNGVYVYFRYDDSQTIMLVLNKTDQNQQVELTPFAEMNLEWKLGKEMISGAEIHFENLLSVDGKQPMIIEFE